jgi:hypothetical protein
MSPLPSPRCSMCRSLGRRLRYPAIALCSVLGLSLLLESCATTAPPAVPGAPASTALQTFDTLYSSAVSADDLVIRTSTTALQSGLITAAQATKILSVTDSVKSALDAANAAAQLGNTGLATGNLAAALGPIGVLSACLAAKPLTVATFDKCATTLAPAVTP